MHCIVTIINCCMSSIILGYRIEENYSFGCIFFSWNLLQLFKFFIAHEYLISNGQLLRIWFRPVCYFGGVLFGTNCVSPGSFWIRVFLQNLANPLRNKQIYMCWYEISMMNRHGTELPGTHEKALPRTFEIHQN